VIHFIYVDEIVVLNGFNVYSSHIGWVFLTIALIPIIQAFKGYQSFITMKILDMLSCLLSIPETIINGLEGTNTKLTAYLGDKIYKHRSTYTSLPEGTAMADDSNNYS
jgi:hypothetical protein